MTLMDGRQLSSKILEDVKTEIERLKLKGVRSGLALVMAGYNESSISYFFGIRKACRKIGIIDYPYQLSDDISMNGILDLIKELNNDKRVNGIIVFLNLPRQLDGRTIVNAIAPEKDVDGLGAMSFGRLAAEESTSELFLPSRNFYVGSTFLQCTSYGVMRLLEYHGIDPKGKDVVIVGKGLTVGKSLALMMLAREATVTICHKATKDLIVKTKAADILCVAIGKPGLITADMVKDGVIAIDIGISVLPQGKVVGDIDFEGVSKKASYITPVPGGVGPVTVAMLLKNTVTSAKRMFELGLG